MLFRFASEKEGSMNYLDVIVGKLQRLCSPSDDFEGVRVVRISRDESRDGGIIFERDDGAVVTATCLEVGDKLSFVIDGGTTLVIGKKDLLGKPS